MECDSFVTSGGSYGSGGTNNTIQASIDDYCVSGLGRIGLNWVVGYRGLPSCKASQVSMDVILGSTAMPVFDPFSGAGGLLGWRQAWKLAVHNTLIH